MIKMQIDYFQLRIPSMIATKLFMTTIVYAEFMEILLKYASLEFRWRMNHNIRVTMTGIKASFIIGK